MRLRLLLRLWLRLLLRRTPRLRHRTRRCRSRAPGGYHRCDSPPPPLPVPSRTWGLRPQTPVSALRPRPQTPDGLKISAPPAFEERGLGRSPRRMGRVGAAGARKTAQPPEATPRGSPRRPV
ncbi:hypothetical protein FE633_16765 [Streptomyces montanus]|uniref:Uncharacterized protein n=1 Tax=Streptomyces montanus TaxID=2580423 RepID=A0A5R9FTA2_9ACTN|nr:hypothetical protein FE633_16765 [Streptomyces montanus]